LVIENLYNPTEYSVENIECYMDIMKYRGIPFRNPEDRHPHVQRMKQLYFNGMMSSLEVNIDGKTLKSLEKNIKLGLYEDGLFDDVETKILENLSDTYSRMIISFEYLNLRNRNEFYGELYEE
jgi:hypothetical protein